MRGKAVCSMCPAHSGLKNCECPTALQRYGSHPFGKVPHEGFHSCALPGKPLHHSPPDSTSCTSNQHSGILEALTPSCIDRRKFTAGQQCSSVPS